MQEIGEKWNQWLEQFQVIEDMDGIEIMDPVQLEEVERENNFHLPSDYKKFCEIFGACSFSDDLRVYCPNILLSEYCLYSLREGFSDAYETDFSHIEIDVDILPKIEKVLTGSGLVFSDDITAQLFIFDTSSYQIYDESCDIWLADGEGEIDCFSYFGRSFYSFFLTFCVKIENDPLEEQRNRIALPKKKSLLRQFNWGQFESRYG